MTTDFSGRTALITGATSGIGRATAHKFAAAGARVIVSGRDATRGAEAVASIREAGGIADFVPAELSASSSVRALAASALELGGGRVDILVNNAGVFPGGPSIDATEADIDSVYEVNVKAPFMLVAALAPAMIASGSGAIINISTMVANFGLSGLALYGSSKAALQLLTKAWAAEFGGSGVRVNAVSPGPTRTEGTLVMGDGLDQLAAGSPAGFPGAPDDIADAILFLASDAAKHIHGVILPVDGGRLAV
ncbi:MAG TPA: SDR family oxidoreductase [Galbitalea sp.]|jgi:NAD(P)-dependent dehydrogenase (short-subunit alcohol dehydrogenase family)